MAKKNYTNHQKDIKDMQANERQARVRRLEAMIEKAQAAINNGDDRKMHPATINQARSEINEIDRFERGQVRAAKMKNKPRKARKVRLNDKRVNVKQAPGETEQKTLARQLSAEMDKAQGNLNSINSALEHNAFLNGFGTVYSEYDHNNMVSEAKRIQKSIDSARTQSNLTQKKVNYHSREIRQLIAKLANTLNDVSYEAEVNAVTESTDDVGDDAHNHGVRTIRETGYKSVNVNAALVAGDDDTSFLGRLAILAFSLQGVFYIVLYLFHFGWTWIPGVSGMEFLDGLLLAGKDIGTLILVFTAAFIVSYPATWLATKALERLIPFWVNVSEDSFLWAMAAGVYVGHQTLLYLHGYSSIFNELFV